MRSATGAGAEQQAGVRTAGMIEKTKSWEYRSGDADLLVGLYWRFLTSCKIQKIYTFN